MATNELIEANGDQLLTSQEIHELRKAGASAQVRLFFLSISLTELKVPKAKGAKVGLLGLWFLI
jgi:hypothetical protein